MYFGQYFGNTLGSFYGPVGGGLLPGESIGTAAGKATVTGVGGLFSIISPDQFPAILPRASGTGGGGGRLSTKDLAPPPLHIKIVHIDDEKDLQEMEEMYMIYIFNKTTVH